MASALVFAGCAQAVEPRWADTARVGRVEVHESPREVVVIEASPEIGELQFDGVVVAATSMPVSASNDGRIVDNTVATGDRVRAGQTVLRFQPTPSRASELEREVLLLQRELAVEQGAEDALAEADASIAAFDQALAATATDVRSPVDGVVLGVTDGLTQAVDEGNELFAIATSSDVVIAVETTAERSEGIVVGNVVRVRRSLVGSREQAAMVSAIETRPNDDQVQLTILPTAPLESIEIGQRIEIEVDLSAVEDGDDVLWIERRAVHRRNGDSFLLAEATNGGLQRLDVRFGRRTTTHVEVREIATIGALTPGTVLVLP